MEKLRRELEEKRAEALRAQSALNSKETVRISSSRVFLLLTFASVDVYICAIDAYCDFFPVSQSISCLLPIFTSIQTFVLVVDQYHFYNI